jgi:hypothetical protein
MLFAERSKHNVAVGVNDKKGISEAFRQNNVLSISTRCFWCSVTV